MKSHANQTWKLLQLSVLFGALLLLFGSIGCAATASIQTENPIQVTQFWGGTAQQVIYQSAVYFQVKNTGSTPIVIKAVDYSSSLGGSKVKWGTLGYDGMGKPTVNPNVCDEAAHKSYGCSIPLSAGQSTYIMVWTPGRSQCGLSGTLTEEESINSISKGISNTLRIHYLYTSRYPDASLPNTMKTYSVSMSANCEDYFRCTSDQVCRARYGQQMPFFCNLNYGNCYYAE